MSDNGDDGYDWEDLLPLYNDDGSVAGWIPRKMHTQLCALDRRHHTLSDEALSDELARIMRFPRQMLDQVAAMSAELREQVKNREIDFAEAVRRSRQ